MKLSCATPHLKSKTGRRLLPLLLTCLMLAPAASHSDPLDLTQFARITATDTRNTFLGLWPRETEDAAYTVRDGDSGTSWKIPRVGSHTIQIDFAPLVQDAPTIASIEAVWGREPNTALRVRLFDYCGGRVLHQSYWARPSKPYLIYPPVEAFCIDITATNAGPANLAELHVYAAEVKEPPAIGALEALPLPDGIRLIWSLQSDSVHHVQIHYVTDVLAPLSVLTLVDKTTAPGSWEGPRPAIDGMVAAVVPVAEDGTQGDAQFVQLPAQEIPPLDKSGVVEGFYGRPWSHAERRAMILRLARLGLGIYIYAPKNDPLHRDKWREPYSKEMIALFEELENLGEMLGVTVSFGISPGKDMDIDDPSERATLLEKLRPFVERGFSHFTLLFDDIEWDIEHPVNAELAAKHVDLANWLKGELSALAGYEVQLWFVPTVYSTKHQNDMPEGADYLDVLAGLDPSIDIMWTGLDVLSPTLDAKDVADVTARTGRKPVIWDNSHATDGGDLFLGKVYLAPYTSRSADLVGAVNGIVANPMILGAPDRIVLGTYASFLHNPTAYDPGQALALSCELEGGGDLDVALAVKLSRMFDGWGKAGFPGVNLPSYAAMDEAVDAFKASVPKGSFAEMLAAGSKLLHIAANMVVTQGEMHHSTLDTWFVDDLWFPTDHIVHDGYALLWMLKWIGSILAGTPNYSSLSKADSYLKDSIFDRYKTSFLKVLSLRLHLWNVQLSAMGFVEPLITNPLTQPKAGEQWIYTPCYDPSASVAIYGLPGAYVDQGTIYWTPQHPGLYKAIVVATSDFGWAWKELKLAVGLEPKEEKEDDSGNDEGCGCSFY